jgi:hypothetical protein
VKYSGYTVRTARTLSLAIVLVLATPTVVSAAAGRVDPSFGASGRVLTEFEAEGVASDVVVGAGRSIYVVGSRGTRGTAGSTSRSELREA